jgi:subtilisin family serine protease
VHEHRFDFENPITTVNLSIGQQWNADTLPNWATLEEELKQLYDDGIFVSVAAGNDFAKFNAPGLSYPAVSPYVVPVGSVTSGGVFSSFSQRDDRILAAPGQSITSTLPDWFMGGNKNPNDFGAASGTSMAAPYVAGAAVLVREAMEFVGYATITQETIYDQLRNTADSFYDSVT